MEIKLISKQMKIKLISKQVKIKSYLSLARRCLFIQDPNSSTCIIFFGREYLVTHKAQRNKVQKQQQGNEVTNKG
jgi:hypothetical protein